MGRSVKLEPGLDFRLPEYRREVFLSFYAFHLKYKAHPGAVYYVMPWLAAQRGWGPEEKLWFCFLNGNTQNPVTSYIIFQRYPSASAFMRGGGKEFLNDHWDSLQFDIDRRYQKKDLAASVAWYYEQTAVNHPSQVDYFREAAGGGDAEDKFRSLWAACQKGFPSFGRLAAFSYLEYLRVMGANIDCDSLFLEDISGSASHRNGLALVTGRDDLISDDKVLGYQGTAVKYSKDDIAELTRAGAQLLADARALLPGESDVSYFTLESTLCTYKSWHKANRRYPNVYNDLLHGRIRWAMGAGWPKEDTDLFWQCREECLPEYLRLECNPNDPGLTPEKTNFYLTYGIPVMMSKDYPEFDNQFDRKVWRPG